MSEGAAASEPAEPDGAAEPARPPARAYTASEMVACIQILMHLKSSTRLEPVCQLVARFLLPEEAG
eukprot:7160191-Alexandrium_andersonii.AAC.1